MQKYRFGGLPETELEKGGLLEGLSSEGLDASDYNSDRARNLYVALDVHEDDEEYTLGVLPDGRWALTGLFISGYDFVVED